MIRILLVDDHANVLQGLKMRLELENDLAIVGSALSGSEALRLAGEVNPDVVLMDWEMPGMDGITATRLLLAQQQAMKVIILSIHNEATLQAQALEAGAVQFVSKHSGIETLIKAIHRAAKPQVDP